MINWEKLHYNSGLISYQGSRQLWCIGIAEKAFGYKVSTLHRMMPDILFQRRDFANDNGTEGRSICRGTFHSEIFRFNHMGALSAANWAPNTNGPQFFTGHQRYCWMIMQMHMWWLRIHIIWLPNCCAYPMHNYHMASHRLPIWITCMLFLVLLWKEWVFCGRLNAMVLLNIMDLPVKPQKLWLFMSVAKCKWCVLK